jgi:AcrR family transcriptional regulator
MTRHGNEIRNGSRARLRRPEVLDFVRQKLVDAAGPVFAERGYHSATIREICMHAGANVAAVNYYFGGKLGLYAEVLQQSVRAANLQAVQNALNQDAPPEKILRDVIRARLLGLCQGNFRDWQFRIMVHELAHPSPALTRVVNDIARPIYGRLLDVIGRIIGLAPDHDTTRLCAHSVLGQVLHYALANPLLLRMWPQLKMTPKQVGVIANHIADFSLAYLRQIRMGHVVVPMTENARRSN